MKPLGEATLKVELERMRPGRAGVRRRVIQAIHVRERAQQPMLLDRRTGELRKRGQVLVERRIGAAQRFEVADVERIGHLLIEAGGERVVACIGRVPALLGQGIEARGHKQPVGVLPPIGSLDQHVGAEPRWMPTRQRCTRGCSRSYRPKV